MDEVKIDEHKKKFLLKIYNSDPRGTGKLILKELIFADYKYDEDFADKMFNEFLEFGLVSIPPRSFSFRLTPKGYDLCKRYFI